MKLFLFFTLLISPLFSIEFNDHETLLLDKFFRTMFTESEGGYVFFDTKPLCIHGVDDNYAFYEESKGHHTICMMNESLPVIKKLPINSPYIVYVYPKPRHQHDSMHHVLIINRKLFIDTVNQNISLFQYILGYEVTGEKLLAKLFDPNETFDSVLKENKTLIGIILGFGAPSSIVVSRQEDLEDAYFAEEKIPFKSSRELYKSYNKMYQSMLLRGLSNEAALSLTPSFNYASLKDEMDDCYDKIQCSTEKLCKNNPRFIYGALKNDKNVQKQLAELEATQDKINEFLDDPDFLPKILAKIYPQQDCHIGYIGKEKLSFNEYELKQLSTIVVNEIMTSFEENECLKFDTLIQGMKSCEMGKPLPITPIEHLQDLHKKCVINERLKNTEAFFKDLNRNNSYQQVAETSLYFKTLKEGSGESLTHENQVKIILSDQALNLNLNEAIVGLAWGIKGMKRGEVREIVMHPTLAYGLYTTLGKGVPLTVRVELIDFKDIGDSFPKLEFIAIDPIIPAGIEDKFKQVQEEDSFRLGYKMWEHYKKFGHFTLNALVRELQEVQGKELPTLTSEERSLLNRLHWSIYNQ